MVQEVRLPFGIFNAIPGISGIEDVVFRIPQLSDIEDAVDDFTLDFPDIEDAVENGIDGFEETIVDAIDFADDIVDPIVEDLEETLGVDFPDPDDLVDDIVDGLEDALPEIDIDLSALASELEQQLDLSEISEVQIDIRGSLFDVDEDVVRLFEEILSEVDLLGALGIPTSIEDIEAFLPDEFNPEVGPIVALRGAVAALTRFFIPLREFTLDPVGTVSEWLVTLVEDGLETTEILDDESAQRLQERAERYR